MMATAGLSRTDQALRTVFKYINKGMLLMWRLGLNRWGMRNPYSGYIMVLTHTGRKTGASRRTPVNYALIDGDVYCVTGFGAGADWYKNIIASPYVEVWLPDSWWTGAAEDISTWPAGKRLPLLRQVLINSGFAAYAAGIDPRQVSAEALERATAEYKLIRIRRTAARTGPGGPGDLAWVWPAAASVLLVLWLRALGRKKGERVNG